MTELAPPFPFSVLLNAQAGCGLARRKWPELRGELERRQIAFQLLEPGSASEARAQVSDLPAGQPIMTLGGEGTVAAILPALVGTGRPLAIIPLGSGNDFAGMLGLKAGDFAEALNRLSYAPRLVDVLDVHLLAGEGTGKQLYLLNGLGMGFDAQVNLAMKGAPEAWPGLARYVWGAAVSVRDLNLIPVNIEVDGQPFYAGPSALCSVMNGTRFGGGFRISPLSDARDGLLNVIASGGINRLELVKLMLQVAAAKHLGQPKVHAATGQEVRVRWQRPIALHLDGDEAGTITEVLVRVRPNAVQLLNA